MRYRKAPVHVMHVLGSFGYGGAEMGVVRMIRALGGPDVKHSVLSLSSDLSLKDALPDGIFCRALERREKDRTVFLRLRTLFRRQQVDIAHVNNLGPWFDTVLAARLSGCKCIQTFHGVENPDIEFSPAKKLQARCSLGLGHGVTAVSATAAQLFSRVTGIDVSRVRVIDNGVDTDLFSPADAGTIAELKKRLNLPEQGVLIGCVAGFRRVKNHTGLFRAFAQVLDKFPGAVLVLIGDGPLRRELETRAAELGITDHVRFAGQSDRIPDYLRCLDLFALNSKTEGFSYALMEAMSTGIPVVATRVGGNRVLVKEGQSGFLTEEGDAGSLARAMTGLLADSSLRREMGRAARQIILDRYALSRATVQYQRLYFNAVEG
ncbi:MAG: glycosyltransferase [Desulfobacterales bacterium]|nr:glycosyltransferase [Desulfobacterales bacterium]